MAQRRELSFSRLDEIMPDVDRLLAGHTTIGNWSLGQICNHIGGAIRYSVEGFPGRAPWLIRTFLAPRAKREIFQTGKMRTGIKVPDTFLPKPGLDDRAEAEALRASLQLFGKTPGPLAPHPFFGSLTRDEWVRLHCIHCAHHLSFAVPNTTA